MKRWIKFGISVGIVLCAVFWLTVQIVEPFFAGRSQGAAQPQQRETAAAETTGTAGTGQAAEETAADSGAYVAYSYYMGEQVTDSLGFSYVIHDYSVTKELPETIYCPETLKWSDGFDETGLKPGWSYIIIHLTVRNDSGERAYWAAGNLILQYCLEEEGTDGEYFHRYGFLTTSTVEELRIDAADFYLEPGEERTIDVVFYAVDEWLTTHNMRLEIYWGGKLPAPQDAGTYCYLWRK